MSYGRLIGAAPGQVGDNVSAEDLAFAFAVSSNTPPIIIKGYEPAKPNPLVTASRARAREAMGHKARKVRG